MALSYQIFYMHMIILRVICQQPCVLVLQFCGNQVNIPTVRTKTSGANSIKSKSVNTWNDLHKLFIKKQFVYQKRNFCTSLIKSYFIKGYV